MRVRCKYCGTKFESKDKYCPYCFARYRENSSVTITEGRARAGMFKHEDLQHEREHGCAQSTPRPKESSRTSTARPIKPQAAWSVRTSSNTRNRNRPHAGTSVTKIIAWVIIAYVLFQLFMTILMAILF